MEPRKSGKDPKTSSMRSLAGSQQFELVPGMTKNKSQYFGGKITTPGQLGSSHNLTLNA